MRDSRREFFQMLVLAGGTILAGWLFWVSRAVVDLETQVAVLKYGVFRTVTRQEVKPSEREPIEANPDLAKFFNSLSKELKK